MTIRSSKYDALIINVQQQFENGKPLVHIITKHKGFYERARRLGKDWKIASSHKADCWIVRQRK